VSVDVFNHSTSDVAHTVSARNDMQTGAVMEWPAEIACTLNAAFGSKQGLEDQHALSGASLFVASTKAQVRRLTPRECERLQGFPDDYTLIPYRNKPASDGPRYKALGNSMAVPVMAWIGKRIQMVNEIAKEFE
jgi:site-specific DNA-cytosine methylase